jgi:hypothetical protein
MRGSRDLEHVFALSLQALPRDHETPDNISGKSMTRALIIFVTREPTGEPAVRGPLEYRALVRRTVLHRQFRKVPIGGTSFTALE